MNATGPLKPVAILGGSFDPVTNAHLAAAERVAAEGFRVVLMPCSDRHEFGKRLLPARERVELLRLAVGARHEISLLEIQSGLSRTADTWAEAVRRYGPVHWVIGTDNVAQVPRWHDGGRLIRELPFLIVERAGHALPAHDSWCHQPPHRVLPAEFDGSSTRVRDRIRAGDWATAAALVPPPVLTHIRAQGWYQEPALLAS